MASRRLQGFLGCCWASYMKRKRQKKKKKTTKKRWVLAGSQEGVKAWRLAPGLKDKSIVSFYSLPRFCTFLPAPEHFHGNRKWKERIKLFHSRDDLGATKGAHEKGETNLLVSRASHARVNLVLKRMEPRNFSFLSVLIRTKRNDATRRIDLERDPRNFTCSTPVNH